MAASPTEDVELGAGREPADQALQGPQRAERQQAILRVPGILHCRLVDAVRPGVGGDEARRDVVGPLGIRERHQRPRRLRAQADGLLPGAGRPFALTLQGGNARPL